MKVANWFRLTSLAILVQIALGGLVTFDFIGPVPHILSGVVVVALAVTTVALTLRSKPPDRQLRQVSVALVAALSLQVILGFTTLAIGSAALAWVHLVLGVLIYAMALTGMSFAQRRETASPSIHEGAGGLVVVQATPRPWSVSLAAVFEILTASVFILGGTALLTFASDGSALRTAFGVVHFPIAISFLVLGVATLISPTRRVWTLGLAVVLVSVLDDLVAFAFVPLPFDGAIGTGVVLITALVAGYLLSRPDSRSFLTH